MSLTIHGAPRITAEQAAELALRFYGRKVVASALPSERDQNFLLRDSGAIQATSASRFAGASAQGPVWRDEVSVGFHALI